jgi:hypothetical protein
MALYRMIDRANKLVNVAIRTTEMADTVGRALSTYPTHRNHTRSTRFRSQEVGHDLQCKKRFGIWTVCASETLMKFETYISAVDTAQSAAEVLRDHERTKR